MSIAWQSNGIKVHVALHMWRTGEVPAQGHYGTLNSNPASCHKLSHHNAVTTICALHNWFGKCIGKCADGKTLHTIALQKLWSYQAIMVGLDCEHNNIMSSLQRWGGHA